MNFPKKCRKNGEKWLIQAQKFCVVSQKNQFEKHKDENFERQWNTLKDIFFNSQIKLKLIDGWIVDTYWMIY